VADIRTGSKYLAQIEDAVEQIQMKKDISQNLELIRRMLNLEFKATCEKVYLTNNNTQSYFFGVHVFPAKKELYNIADKVITVDKKVKFENCREFIIELDSKLMYQLGATPREITSALLHEVGHKVYGREAQIRSKVMFLNSAIKYGGLIGGIIRIASPLKYLLFSAILVTFSNSLQNWLRLKDELDADSFAVKYGYAADLHSLLGKLTKDNHLSIGFGWKGKGSRQTIGSDESEKAIMRWSLQNIMDFSLRRGEIIRTLQQQLREEPSDYGKEVIKLQLEEINKRRKPGINLSMSSANALKKEDALLDESIKSFIELQTKGMSYLEVDEISVEVDRIETHEDKIYIITRIYRNLAIADKALKKIEHDNTSSGKARKEQFKDYVKELKDLLEKTKSTKVKETRYGVFIKYPTGDYEQLD
jgi:hypothetical protein